MKHPTYFSCLISTIFIPLDQVLMLKSFTIENVYCFGTKYTFLHHFSKFSSNVDVNGTFHMPQWAHVHHMCYIRLSYNAWMLYNWYCILFCDWIHFFLGIQVIFYQSVSRYIPCASPLGIDKCNSSISCWQLAFILTSDTH